MKFNISYLCLLAAILFCYIDTNAQQKNKIEQLLDWGYRKVEGDSARPKHKYFFVVPIVSYKPETRWLLGVNFSYFFKPNVSDTVTRTSFLRFNFTISQNKQYSIRPFFDVFTKNNKYNFRGQYQYTDFIENYWGVGQSAPESDKELYSFKQHKAFFKGLKRLKQSVYLGIQANLENTYQLNLAQAPKMQAANYTGTSGYFEFGLGPIISFDNRNHIYWPTAGHFIDISSTFYQKAMGSNHNFTNVAIDARKYIGLGGENALALQLFGQFNWGTVPYRMLGTIGNETYLRGYYFGRYRDHHAVTMQAELRKSIWGPIGMVAFTGFGDVGANLNELGQKLKPIAGLGLRFKAIPKERVNVRIDYAIGEKGINALYINMNEAF